MSTGAANIYIIKYSEGTYVIYSYSVFDVINGGFETDSDLISNKYIRIILYRSSHRHPGLEMVHTNIINA